MNSHDNFKTVKKDTDVVEDLSKGIGIFTFPVDAGTDSFYDIYIAATVKGYNNSNQTDYYIAKHSTLFNLTEWYRQSNQTHINETVRGLHFDVTYKVCYVVVEVCSNTYMNTTVDELRVSDTWTNQTNLAVV